MEFLELAERARDIQLAYKQLNERQGHQSWGAAEYMQGFVGDVGDLAKLIMAKNNFRDIDDTDKKIAHELADCLWSVIVLANELHVDLEAAFKQTMDELENRVK
jgi:NTP pyrophosphatase (non-canonical NTP hydrolase)